jgi:hypothetical protein
MNRSRKVLIPVAMLAAGTVALAGPGGPPDGQRPVKTNAPDATRERPDSPARSMPPKDGTVPPNQRDGHGDGADAAPMRELHQVALELKAMSHRARETGHEEMAAKLAELHERMVRAMKQGLKGQARVEKSDGLDGDPDRPLTPEERARRQAAREEWKQRHQEHMQEHRERMQEHHDAMRESAAAPRRPEKPLPPPGRED